MFKTRSKGLVFLFASVCIVSMMILSTPASSSAGDKDTGHIAPGITRFFADGADFSSLSPSFAVINKPEVKGPVPADWKVMPEFVVSDKKYSAIVKTEKGTSLYGTGEIAGPLLRDGKVTYTWNIDSVGYGGWKKNLYQSHPWVLAVRKDGTSFGVLADTTYKLKIDLTNGISFTSEGHPFPVYIIDADSPQQVMKKLSVLIGTIALPPKWAIGYHQCRWSYYPEARAKEIADEFRRRKLPCDVIWFDIHYMDGYRVFTFDDELYPDPKRMNDYLHDNGFKSIWMIDPGVKKEEGYWVYDQGVAGNHFIKDKNGVEFNGKVWPGQCAFPDYTRPETQQWWSGLYKDFMATGIDGVWNDMNEPALIQLPKTMPGSNLHSGGGELPPADHALYHNVYGMLMVKYSREGIMAANPDKRPFILTRSNFIGGQRYAATWTGDNLATWKHVRHANTMILNMGLSGQPFVGPDIGGFIGPGTPNMFARWFGVGVFYPFSRGHATEGSINKEPWEFGPEVETSCKTALERRYRLMPYLYTLFQESSKNGMPVMRPTFFADPADPALRDQYESFLVGSDLLVLAQLKKAANTKHAMLKGIWRTISLVGEDHTKDVNQPELKIRGGAIIPLGKIIQSTVEKSLDPLTLLVCLDENGMAEGVLYEDAGEGYGYQNGDYLLTKYSAVSKDGKVIVKIALEEGKMKRPDREVVVEVVTEDGVVMGKGIEKRVIKINL
jgi:alpha-glucosidase